MNSTTRPQHKAWWKESSVYQIYPASFKDSNDDGIGDLEGVISKVDYLHNLGIECVWLSPILKSPQVDMGYDISDYKLIDSQYGSLEDVDRLTKELNSRGMKLIMDLVVNHTSDQHEWFQNSRSSKDSEYRDWYIWKPARYDDKGNRMPPNNWAAFFQGSAWEWDEASQEYYLHLFAVEQPDLNWENSKVRAAVHDIIRFWLNRGASGFRMDVINFISKEPGLPDAPVNPELDFQDGTQFFSAGPHLHEYLKEIGAILKEYDAFSVGEMPCVHDPKEVIKSVGFDRGELAMIFQFDHVDVDHGPLGKFSHQETKWPLSRLRDIFNTMQTFMYEHDGWNALYLENHDQPRSVSRFASGAPEYRARSSKMLATFIGCQAGTPFIYEGQEIGMSNVPKAWPIEEYKDLETQNHWRVLNSKTKDSAVLKEALGEYQKKSRDNARTPMQWDASPHAGFTSANSNPWMRAMDNYTEVNAESQTNDPDSPFTYWKSMLAMRKKYKDIVVYGNFEMLDQTNEKIIAYTRESEAGKKMLVVCNFSSDKVEWKTGQCNAREVVMSSYGRAVKDFEGDSIALNAYEAVLLLL